MALENGVPVEPLERAIRECSKGKAFFGGEATGLVDIALGSHLMWIKVVETRWLGRVYPMRPGSRPGHLGSEVPGRGSRQVGDAGLRKGHRAVQGIKGVPMNLKVLYETIN